MAKRRSGNVAATIKKTDIVFAFDELVHDTLCDCLNHTTHGVAYDIWMREDGAWRWSVEYRGCDLEELLGSHAPARWGEICYPWPLALIDEDARCDSALDAYLDMRAHVQASPWWRALDD